MKTNHISHFDIAARPIHRQAAPKPFSARTLLVACVLALGGAIGVKGQSFLPGEDAATQNAVILGDGIASASAAASSEIPGGSTLVINIFPPPAIAAGARWRFATDTSWRDSGAYYTNIPNGRYQIEFKPVAGWIAPINRPFDLTSRGEIGMTVGYQSESTPPLTNLFIVQAFPAQVIGAGAQWKFSGDTSWHDIGPCYTNPTVGTNFVEFKPVSGWLTPDQVPIVMYADTYLITVSMTYRPAPTFTLKVDAANGEVAGESWAEPQACDFLLMYSAWIELQSLRWETMKATSHPRAYPLDQSDYDIPADNSGRLVQLTAMPHPGYRFAGWSGDAIGARNPIHLVMDANKSVTANFAPVSAAALTATQLADGYYSPGTLTVHGQINCPGERPLKSLKWRPILPAGWSLISASGLGQPAVQEGAVVFSGDLAKCDPVQFNLTIGVPEGMSGTREIRGEIEYTTDAQTNGVTASASPNLLTLPCQDSPAARLSPDISAGTPALRIQGIAGKTYFLQQAADLALSTQAVWTYRTHLTLTNAALSWADTQPLVNGVFRFYRAVLVQ